MSPLSNTRTTSASCMRDALALETRAAALYTTLAARLEAEPRLAKLFRSLASEEEQHAMRVRLIARHHSRVSWPPESLERIGEDLRQGIAVVADIERTVSSTPDLKPMDALLATVELEKLFETVHQEMMSTASEPAVRALFESLSAQDQAHRQLVRVAMDRLGEERGASGGSP